MSKNKDNKGLRKNKDSLTEIPLHTAHTPLFPVEKKIRNLRVTIKQNDILTFISQGMNPSSIARLRNVKRQTIKGQIDSLKKKGLIESINYVWVVTKFGNQYLDFRDEKVGVGTQGGAESVKENKGRHSNNYHVNILKSPLKYKNKEFWDKCSKDFTPYASTKQIIIKFDWGTGVISYGTNKLSLYFNEVSGVDYENIEVDFFDKFVSKFKLFESLGFELDNFSLTCSKPHYHNKEGIFAHMCNIYTGKGFKIEVGDNSFWVDYSDGDKSEEETNSYELALKIEKFSESVIKNDVDMYDLKEIKEIVQGLVQRDILRERMTLSKSAESYGEATYFG